MFNRWLSCSTPWVCLRATDCFAIFCTGWLPSSDLASFLTHLRVATLVSLFHQDIISAMPPLHCWHWSDWDSKCVFLSFGLNSSHIHEGYERHAIATITVCPLSDGFFLDNDGMLSMTKIHLVQYHKIWDQIIASLSLRIWKQMVWSIARLSRSPIVVHIDMKVHHTTSDKTNWWILRIMENSSITLKF